jgi:hypothetical protein
VGHLALKDLKLDSSALKRQLTLIEKTVASTKVILLIFHGDRLSKLPNGLQKVIFATMPPKARQVAKGLA